VTDVCNRQVYCNSQGFLITTQLLRQIHCVQPS